MLLARPHWNPGQVSLPFPFLSLHMSLLLFGLCLSLFFSTEILQNCYDKLEDKCTCFYRVHYLRNLLRKP